MPTDTSIFLETAGAGAGANYVIEWMRASPFFTWLPKNNERVAFTVKMLTALVLTLGIHFRWDEAARDIVVHIPTTADIAHGAWSWFIQASWMMIAQNVKQKTTAY